MENRKITTSNNVYEIIALIGSIRFIDQTLTPIKSNKNESYR